MMAGRSLISKPTLKPSRQAGRQLGGSCLFNTRLWPAGNASSISLHHSASHSLYTLLPLSKSFPDHWAWRSISQRACNAFLFILSQQISINMLCFVQIAWNIIHKWIQAMQQCIAVCKLPEQSCVQGWNDSCKHLHNIINVITWIAILRPWIKILQMIPGEENIKFFVKDIVINAVVMMGYKFINNMYKLFLLR